MDTPHLLIKRLTPQLLADYLYFFEQVAHTDNKDWDRCYCLNYCAADNNELARTRFFDPDERRDYAIEYVNSGVLQGYLAYWNGQVVGWCNANERNRCLRCVGCNFIYGSTPYASVPERVKSVYCFTVAPDYRGRGIATALLQRVIEDARAEGYSFVEGYPEIKTMDIYYSYSGHKALYNKLDFTPIGITDYRYIVRKPL